MTGGSKITQAPSPPLSASAPLASAAHAPQFDFIDGLRAVCALYIVLTHSVQTAGLQAHWAYLLGFGYEIVLVFITISGFCLALPLARRNDWRVDTSRFYFKRARRILPPYYAAVVLGLLVVGFRALHGTPADYLDVPFTPAMIWSHLALVQNWMPSQLGTLDGPLWSVAVECQIYIFFPLLVLLRRRTGRIATLALWLIGVQLLMKTTGSGGYCSLLFIFALGAFGSDLAYLPSSRRWLLPAVVPCALGAALLYAHHGGLADICIGLSVALLMAYLAQRPQSAAGRLLGWKPLAWVGTFSYSLYLVHSLVQIGFARALPHTWQLATPPHRFAALVLFIPVILAVSYGFHIVFERPFMGQFRQRAESQLAPATLA